MLEAEHAQQEIFIAHTGGDPIGTPSVKILALSAESFGTSTHAIDTVNISAVTDCTGTAWLIVNDSIGVKSFHGGEVAIIRPSDHLGPAASRLPRQRDGSTIPTMSEKHSGSR